MYEAWVCCMCKRTHITVLHSFSFFYPTNVFNFCNVSERHFKKQLCHVKIAITVSHYPSEFILLCKIGSRNIQEFSHWNPKVIDVSHKHSCCNKNNNAKSISLLQSNRIGHTCIHDALPTKHHSVLVLIPFIKFTSSHEVCL